MEKQPQVLPLKSLIGSKVMNLEGERLGRVAELLVNLATGRICYAIIEVDRFPGWKKKMVAVPLAAMNMSPEERIFYINSDRETLAQAPCFENAELQDRFISN